MICIIYVFTCIFLVVVMHVVLFIKLFVLVEILVCVGFPQVSVTHTYRLQ